MQILALLAIVVAVASLAEAHKKFYNAQPIYHEPQHERCICDCAQQQPILPNKPYYGNAGYHQPRPSGGGYGNAGAYAVAGSYGAGNGQISGGY